MRFNRSHQPPVAQADARLEGACVGPEAPDSGEGSPQDRAPAGRGGWGLAAVALAALAVWLAVAVPLAAGSRTLFFRDVFSNHFALKAFGARELAAGRVPALNPAWGLGQPYRGNPSALAFYPGNLLYLALPFWSAFNLHYALHWLLAALTFFALARELGQGRPAALVAALTWAGSGWLLSCLSFYNLIAVAAWWPLAMWGAARGGRRGIGIGGLACGMALLAGEPVTAALGVPPLLLAASAPAALRADPRTGAGSRGRWRWRRGLGTTAAIGALGLAVALPQLVATLRVTGFTWRGAHGMIASQAASYTLHPLRYLELAVPFPFGRPTDFGATGFWADGLAPELPFYLTLHAGVVALLLAAGAVRRRPAWAALAAAGLAGAWLAGLSGELLIALTAGLFRYPEKLLFWYALALPLLAGWGLERALERAPGGARRQVRAAWGGAVLAAALAALAAALRPALVGYAEGLDAPAAVPRGELVDAQLGLWVAALAAAAILLAAAGWALARLPPRPLATALAALQLAGLLQLWPLVRTDATEPYRRPAPWAERAREVAGGAGAAVLSSHLTNPAWHPSPRYDLPAGSRARLERLQALDLAAAPGVLHGLTYPIYPDIEGMSSPLYAFLNVNLARMDWTQRLRWMRALGVDAVVLFEDPGVEGLRPLDRTLRAGVPTWLFAVEGGAPEVWWPERVFAAAHPLDALLRVNVLDDPVATVVASRPVDHRPGASVRLLAAGPDALTVAVSGAGGVLAVRRSYQHLWTARAGGRELPVAPLDLTLTGVEVPPGEHTVELTVSSRPETLAAAGGLAAALACLALAWSGRRRRCEGVGREARGGAAEGDDTGGDGAAGDVAGGGDVAGDGGAQARPPGPPASGPRGGG